MSSILRSNEERHEGINMQETIETTRRLLSEDNTVSPAIKSAVELLLLIIGLLAGRLGLNSRNSSKSLCHHKGQLRKKKLF